MITEFNTEFELKRNLTKIMETTVVPCIVCQGNSVNFEKGSVELIGFSVLNARFFAFKIFFCEN